MSKTFTDVQQRWSTIDQEMFALYYCITSLYYLIGGRDFVVRTDHYNLQFWDKESASKKVERWRVALSEYSFTVEYVKGTKNVVADAMSRLMVMAPVAKSTRLRGNKLIKLYHGGTNGHFGVNRTVANIRESGNNYVGLVKDVNAFIASCPICQKTSDKKTKSVGQRFSVAATAPRIRLAIDSMGPVEADVHGHEHVLVLVDCFSRFVELVPTRSTTAAEAVQALIALYGRYGHYAEIQSDNGKEFINDNITEFIAAMGARHKRSIAYSHEDNAICERAIKEVRRHLNTMVLEDKDDVIPWSEHLPFVQRLINAQINEATGYAPSVIHFGSYDGNLSSLLQPATDGSASDWIKRLSHLQKSIVEDVAEKNQKSAKKLRPAETVTKFKEGDLVLVDLPATKKGDLKRIYRTGPNKVLSQSDSKVSVANLATPDRIREVHVSRVRRYNSRDDVNNVAEAARDIGEYIVTAILDHKFEGKPSVKNCQVLVRWEGYPEPTWHSLSVSLRHTEAFFKYAQKISALKKFVLAKSD